MLFYSVDSENPVTIQHCLPVERPTQVSVTRTNTNPKAVTPVLLHL